MGEGATIRPCASPRAPLFEALMMHRSRLDPGNSPDFEVCTLAVHQNAPKCTIFCVFSPAYANMSGDETKCNENDGRTGGWATSICQMHHFASFCITFSIFRAAPTALPPPLHAQLLLCLELAEATLFGRDQSSLPDLPCTLRCQSTITSSTTSRQYSNSYVR